MTIEEALHPTKPQEIDTVIPVDIQIDRFYESLRKNVETYIRQSDRNMTKNWKIFGTVVESLPESDTINIHIMD